jgi:hypothetical protein
MVARFPSAVQTPVCCAEVLVFTVIFGCLSLSGVLGDESPAPTTIEDGFQKLEALLGHFAPKDARQFRKSLDSEIREQPEEGGPTVQTISKGQLIFGNPYRVGGAAAFDVVETINRTVKRLTGGNDGTVVRRQQRYSVERYTLRVNETGDWEFDGEFTAHSIPSAIGRPYMVGNVKWLPDGLILHGVGTDNRFAADGSLIRSAFVGEIKIVREKGDLVVDDHWQNYDRLKGPNNTLLPFPDMSRPVGEAHSWMAGKAVRD